MFNLKHVNLDHNETEDFNNFLPEALHELFHIISFGDHNLKNLDSDFDPI